MSDSPFSEPTICDMNCFYERGHEGPHQKWRGDPCDAEMGRERALLDAAKEVMVTSRAVIAYNQAVRLLAAIRCYEPAWEPSQVPAGTPTSL